MTKMIIENFSAISEKNKINLYEIKKIKSNFVYKLYLCVIFIAHHEKNSKFIEQ